MDTFFFKWSFFTDSDFFKVKLKNKAKSHSAWKKHHFWIFLSHRENIEPSEFQKTKFLTSAIHDLRAFKVCAKIQQGQFTVNYGLKIVTPDF